MSAPPLPPTIPLLPLANVALLPNHQLPLRIVEPRYQRMLVEVLASNRVIGLVQIQPGFESDSLGRPPIFSTGTAAIVVRVVPRPDGESDIVVRAFSKFKVAEEVPGAPYRLARVVALEEFLDAAGRASLKAERQVLEDALARSLGGGPGSLRLPPLSDEDLVNSLVMTLEMDTIDRQVLIEQPDALARARTLIELLSAQARSARQPR